MKIGFSRISAVFMAVGILCGAFGAHGLKTVVTPDALQVWEKAVLYHLIHASAAIMLSLYDSPRLPASKATRIVSLFLLSTTIFSGSLYTLVLSGMKWLGAITPLGGLGFVLTWLYLAVALKDRTKSPQNT